MIKADKGTVAISGVNENELMSEFTVTARAVRGVLAEKHDTEYADKKISEAIEISKKTEREIAYEAFDRIYDAIKNGLSDVDDGEEISTCDEPTTGNKDFDAFLKSVFERGGK